MTRNISSQQLYGLCYIIEAVINCTPFSLAFGLEVIMPMEYLVLSLRVVVWERLIEEALIERLVDLEQLDETTSCGIWHECGETKMKKVV